MFPPPVYPLNLGFDITDPFGDLLTTLNDCLRVPEARAPSAVTLMLGFDAPATYLTTSTDDTTNVTEHVVITPWPIVTIITDVTKLTKFIYTTADKHGKPSTERQLLVPFSKVTTTSGILAGPTTYLTTNIEDTTTVTEKVAQIPSVQVGTVTVTSDVPSLITKDKDGHQPPWNLSLFHLQLSPSLWDILQLTQQLLEPLIEMENISEKL